MNIGIFHEYKSIPDLKKWDWYDLNWADDIQEATTDFTAATPQNWELPFPADAEDPDEAIIVDEIFHWLNIVGLADIIDYASGLATGAMWELLRIFIGFFQFDETDETTEPYRDELKEALGWNTLSGAKGGYGDNADGYNYNVAQNVWEASLKFDSPIVFPLNICAKTEYFDPSAALSHDFLESPDMLFTKIRYRVVRNPLEYLGRIIALLRQELSG